jgi:hypothetical protein
MRPLLSATGRAAACIAALAGLATLARAEDSAPTREPVRVALDGVNECFDGDRLLAEIAARTSRVRPASPSEPARLFVIHVERRPAGVDVTLVVLERGQATQPRVVHGATCDEALSAIALVAALSVDPESRMVAPPVVDAGAGPSPADAAAPSASDAESAPVEASAPVGSPPDAITRAARSAWEEADPWVERAPPPPIAPTARRPDAGRWVFGAGGSAVGLTLNGVGGELVVAPAVFVEATREGAGTFVADARVTATRAEGPTVTNSEGTGKVRFFTLDPSSCPLRVANRLLAACADFEVGVVQVEASGKQTTSGAGAWLAPGLGARLAWPAIALGAHAELALDVELGVRVPLVRDAFYFLDKPSDYRVYQAPWAIPWGGADVGVRFW